jgi:DNA-binding winged helix-turn-helix (wHTH) protein
MELENFESQYPVKARNEEIEKILGFVREGRSCQLVGMPGVGRSIVLRLLAHNSTLRESHMGKAQKSMHFVLVNFSEIRKRDLFDAMKFVFLNLADSLRERGMLDEFMQVNTIFKESLSFHDELVLFQGLKEAVDLLAIQKQMTIVLLFDRFEEYIPTLTSEFFTNLRALRTRAKYHLQIVFSVNRPLESFLEPTLWADFYEFVAENIVYVSVHDPVTTQHRIKMIEQITEKSLSKEVKDNIISLTGGLGKLTKLSVESLLAHGGEHKDLTSFLLSQKSIQGALSEIWLSLSPAEQADLLEGKFGDPDIDTYLEQVGLIKNGAIQVPLFAPFIQSHTQNAAAPQSNTIEYDQHTNTIRKGATILSDQLTSSEFRLLRYLLQNQNRIIERDELIGIVWSGVKSTAGITDQAIDQLIFRVRRKIEEDPNNPKHLLTIKGRGFKFEV